MFFYISDRISAQIRNHCKKLKIHARIIFKPGSKLRKHFCNSRPHDNWKCVVTNSKTCVICPDTHNNTCSTKNVVYEITCMRCKKRYIGETERTLHDRMLEHRRAATKPDKHFHLEISAFMYNIEINRWSLRLDSQSTRLSIHNNIKFPK